MTCSTLKKNKLSVIIENTLNIRREEVMAEVNMSNLRHDIIEEILIACVDGSVKNENMGGHMCIRNNDKK